MSEHGGTRALLWVGNPEPTADRAVIEAVCRDLELDVRFTPLEQVDTAMLAQPFDLVGAELGEEPLLAFNLFRELRERLPEVTLFAASADSGEELIRAAIDAGASDILSLPLAAGELHKALIKLTQIGARPAVVHGVNGEIITVYGVRGGLGTTTLAVNLAVQLAAVAKTRVALADLDLQRGDVAAFLNVTPQQSLAAIAGASGEVDELFMHQTLTRHLSGVSVLPAPMQIIEAEGIGPEKVSTALRLLRAQFHFTVVDTPRALTEPTLPAFELADKVLILADLSVPGVRAARRVVELLQRVGIRSERLELVVTEAVPGPVKLEDASRSIGKSPLCVLPRDAEAAARAMNAGAPLNGTRPLGLRASIAQLAARLAGAPAARRRGVFGRLLGRGRRPEA